MAGFISLEDAKAHLRVRHSSEDALIQSYVDAAARHIESMSGFVAGERIDEVFLFDRFERQLELRLRPIDTESIIVSYLDGDGVEQTFSDVRVFEKNGTTRVMPVIGANWPAAASSLGAVMVTAAVGFAATDDAGAPEAPDALKHATRLMVSSWYQDRAEGPVPDAVRLLIGDERARRA